MYDLPASLNADEDRLEGRIGDGFFTIGRAKWETLRRRRRRDPAADPSQYRTSLVASPLWGSPDMLRFEAMFALNASPCGARSPGPALDA